MKKFVSIIFCTVLAISCLSLFACGNANNAIFEGTWTLSAVKDEAGQYNDKTYDNVMKEGKNEQVTFDADGKGQFDLSGVQSDLTWSATSDKEVKIQSEGVETTGILEDNKLVITSSGLVMTFSR
ncbi:MAG: hypothetical protein MJ189_04055 [Coriobacteriales bacterium]|nr:hypothetical protein [Coriobacteriales bacterium]